MKVLHILDELKFSGAETMLASAAPVWIKEGIELHVLSTGVQCGPYSDALRLAGYVVHHIPYVKSLAFLYKVRTLIRHNAYDVVHIHPERGYVIYALAAYLLSKPPVRVKTVHHIFKYRGLLRLRAILMRHFCKRFLRVMFVSNSLSGKENERARYKMNNRYVPNWYDSAVYNREAVLEARSRIEAVRREVGISSDAQVMLISLGGNWAYKNFDMVIKAIAASNRLDLFVYVHCGADEKGELRALARDLGVRFVGMGITPDVIPYLVASDLFMMPSREEGFGIAAVEAMAVGVPLCLSRAPALCDFKEYSNDILWCDPSVGSLSHVLANYKKPDLATKNNISARLMMVAGEFCVEKGALGYLGVYRESRGS